tara:strand:+ start:284 stop:601 length:318 start_codon:yes stop_codon:yes gene_type:complete
MLGTSDPDDMMLKILETLTDFEVVPEVGRYYTFVYKPVTPRIQYDEYPLIACVGLFPWGFRGINYHWGDYRNYNWSEVVGNLHVVYPLELRDMRTIPYQKIRLNT